MEKDTTQKTVICADRRKKSGDKINTSKEFDDELMAKLNKLSPKGLKFLEIILTQYDRIT